LIFEITQLPTNGTLLGVPNVPYQLPGNDVTYTPAPGFGGVDSFKFRVYDGQAYSMEATVTIYVVRG
jgi:hypothetical protein